LVDLDQFLRQRLKAAKLGDFLFCFAHGAERRQGLSNRLACDLLRELMMGTMPGMVGLSTMAVGLATASGHGGNGTRLKVTELRKFPQEMATAVEQFGQRLGHEALQVMI
jgi:hypothetical protein